MWTHRPGVPIGSRSPRKRGPYCTPKHIGDFTLSSREFTTRVGGLFLFIADLVRIDTDALALAAKLPGSRMIPAAHALRAALALKLWSIERKSHVMAPPDSLAPARFMAHTVRRRRAVHR